MRRFSFAVCVCALSLMACPKTDLNQQCSLMKGNPDGGKEPVVVLERELLLPDGGHEGKDFIGIGSVDCEDLICVRDSTYVTDAGLDDPAVGYCSKQCSTSADKPCPSWKPELDDGPEGLVCRPLLLSKETLDLLKNEFPGIYDPNFCARKIPN